jgi:STE24 endopeptidase
MAGRTGDGEQRRAEQYARTREILAVADMLLGMAIMAAALFSGSSARLRSLAERRSRRLAVTLYAAAALVFTSVVSLPLSFLSGYIVEHRFELSNQSPAAWLADWLKGVGVGLALGPPLAQGAFWVIRRWPERWWAVLSALLLPFSVLMVNLAPVLILPLFNKFEPIPDRTLEDRIKKLAAGQGVNVSRVLRMDMSKQTRKANAFFTGIGNTKRIVVADTLLEEFSHEEVEVVLAHELGHQVHRDIWKLIGLQTPLTLGSFAAMHFTAPRLLRRYSHWWATRPEEGVADPAALPLLGLTAGLFSLGTGPVVNAIIRRAIEHRADEYSLRLTRNPSAFISSMQKLGRMNLSDPDPPLVVKWLFHNHPTLRERVEFARRFAEAHGL